jgi:hypothetical protein
VCALLAGYKNVTRKRKGARAGVNCGGFTPARVILNGVKDLSGSTTVNRLGDLEIFRSAQDDTLVVFASSLMSLASLMSLNSLGADCPYIAGYKNVTCKRVGARGGEVGRCLRSRASS